MILVGRGVLAALCASVSRKPNAMWEFVSATETVNSWTTLLPIVERAALEGQ